MPWLTSEIPALTAEQMREVDQWLTERYGIQLIQMMENAGQNLAELARRLLGGHVLGRRVAVLCGSGHNGGGGMVAARHLHNWGAEIQVKLVSAASHLKETTVQQWRIVQRLGLTTEADLELGSNDLILDALLGYGVTGQPHGPVREWIERANAARRPILALDVPSGLDPTTGIPGQPCIRAQTTLTLALPKTGLLKPEARPFVGDLYLADLGVPPQLYRRLGLEVGSLFTENTLLALNEGALSDERSNA